MIRVGAFTLDAPVGKGGMADVWRGTHAASGMTVAVKVLNGARAKEEAFIRALKNEIHAVARLHHPGIIVVFDRGEVSAEAASASGGRLSEGSPYLAMEYASYGALSAKRFPLPWPTTRLLLLALLDALAHAHARGVVHRDLKPGNVLLCGPVDARPGLKLTDFGIAQPLDFASTQGQLSVLSGTPRYMAPEQFTGHWRDFGPWTDLYALGCLAFQASSGKTPFSGDSMRLAVAHCHDAPPPLALDATYPPEFEGWVLRLLEKDPRDRFLRAADAAYALAQLPSDPSAPQSLEGDPSGGAIAMEEALRSLTGFAGDATSRYVEPGDESTSFEPSASPVAALPDADTRQSALHKDDTAAQTLAERPRGRSAKSEAPAAPSRAALLVDDEPLPQPIGPDTASIPEPTAPTTETAYDVGARDLREKSSVPLAPRRRPPIPTTWRRTKGASRARLVGAGLGLYGLRQIPFVDRDPLRDQLWDALREVHEKKTPKVVALTGPAGIGKSRVVEWLCERAAELGAATVLKAVHGPAPGPADGLPRMVASALRAVGLPREEIVHRARKLLSEQGVRDPYEWHAIAELVKPATDEEREKHGNAVRFSSAKERHAVVRRLVERAAAERPVALWLDDVQWGADALQFAHALLDEGTPNVLVLLTARDEDLQNRKVEGRLFDQLLARRGSKRMGVMPLGKEEHRLLVGELLGLEGPLLEDVVERTQGNPLFAVQLVGDLVSRGVLEPAASGFTLKPGAQAALPDDIHELWRDRLERIFAAHPPSARAALELGAVLGAQGDDEEWPALCAEANVALPRSLVDDLMRARLVVEEPGGLRFAHGMLRESVLRSAREGGRVEAHHRMAARMLEKRYGPTARGVAERVGRHSVHGGLLVDALAPLLAGAKEHLEQSSYATAHVLLNERLAALEKLGLPESDHRIGENFALRARLFVEEGDYEQALIYAAKIAARDDDDRWAAMSPHALVVQGAVASKLGQYEEALGRFEKARNLALRRGDFALLVECLSGIGDAHYYSGRLAHAAETFGAALAQCERARDEKGMAVQLWNEAYVALWRGESQKARSLLARQQDLATRTGHRFLLGAGRNALGDVARVEGQHDEAARRYEEALELLEGIGSGKRRVVKVNQALNDLGRGEVQRAERMIEAIVDELERSGERVLISLAHGVLAAAAAHDGDWDLYEHHFEPFLAPQRGAGLKDGEHAMLVELLAEAALFQGQAARARAAFVAAGEAWAALGRDDRAAIAREAVEAIDEGQTVRLTPRRPVRA